MCEFIPEDKGINASLVKIGGRWLIVCHYQDTKINSYLLKIMQIFSSLPAIFQIKR